MVPLSSGTQIYCSHLPTQFQVSFTSANGQPGLLEMAL